MSAQVFAWARTIGVSGCAKVLQDSLSKVTRFFLVLRRSVGKLDRSLRSRLRPRMYRGLACLLSGEPLVLSRTNRQTAKLDFAPSSKIPEVGWRWLICKVALWNAIQHC